MKVVYLPEDGTNFIPYEVMGKNIDFNDGDLMFNVSKKERDYEVVIDICQDYTGALVMGTDSGERYVAQLIVPAREYIETTKVLVSLIYGIYISLAWLSWLRALKHNINHGLYVRIVRNSHVDVLLRIKPRIAFIYIKVSFV